MSERASRTVSGFAADVEDAGIAAEDGHARPDGGLGEVDGCDVAGLHCTQGCGEFFVEGIDELAAGGHRGVGSAFTTDKNDAEARAFVPMANAARASFRSKWPRSSDRETNADCCVKERFPPGAGETFSLFL